MVASFLPSFRSKKTAPLDTMTIKHRRVLGFNTESGRGWVFSTDQSRVHQPEILFLDTPSHPNLQMVCSRIIDQHGKDVACLAKTTDAIGIHDISCEGLTFSFAMRFVCPDKDAKLKRRLDEVYFEGQTSAKHGIVVMVPFMNNVLWGFQELGMPSKMTRGEVDQWIEEVAMIDACPL